MKIIKVLVVDDSALMRRVISDIIAEHDSLELVATARDGLDALKKIESKRPDVVTMDIDMPRLDGLQTLSMIMAKHPLPVIVLSSHTVSGSESTLKALEAGAVDFLPKPSMRSLQESFAELRDILPSKIIAAASAQVDLITETKQSIQIEPPARPPVTAAPADEKARVVIAVGASTGGPKALETFFSNLPADLPAALLLSQHMPPGFTYSFSQRLDLMSQLKVKEAEEGDRLLRGHAFIAPGNYHMIVKDGAIKLDSGPKVNYVRPSIDVMFHSLRNINQKVLVVIMTGMGRDGADGAQVLKKSKGDTIIIAQDPATALISSMPEALIRSVPCDAIVPLEKLASEVSRFVRIMV